MYTEKWKRWHILGIVDGASTTSISANIAQPAASETTGQTLRYASYDWPEDLLILSPVSHSNLMANNYRNELEVTTRQSIIRRKFQIFFINLEFRILTLLNNQAGENRLSSGETRLWPLYYFVCQRNTRIQSIVSLTNCTGHPTWPLERRTTYSGNKQLRVYCLYSRSKNE